MAEETTRDCPFCLAEWSALTPAEILASWELGVFLSTPAAGGGLVVLVHCAVCDRVERVENVRRDLGRAWCECGQPLHQVDGFDRAAPPAGR